MTNETQALVPGPASLPAAIERRTQITNRLLGELTYRDTEGFFRRHLEFFRLVVSRYYPLDEELIERFKDFWDWKELSKNSELPWSDDLLVKYSNRWNRVSDSGQIMFWPIAYLGGSIKNKKTDNLSNELTWSEKLDRTIKILNDLEDDNNCEDHDWEELSRDEELIWSETLLEQFKDYWDWDILSSNKGLPWDKSIIKKFIDLWNWDELSINEALPWSQELINKYENKWNWNLFSQNKSLPWKTIWSQEYLKKYEDIWDPEPLDFIEQFMDENNCHWSSEQINSWCAVQNDLYWEVWINLSKNESLPWSHQLFDKYADRWDIDAVASHYDGNVRSLTPEQIVRLMRALADA
jgi:hypothetical protein